MNAKQRFELEARTLQRNGELLTDAIKWAGWIVVTCASALPLWMIKGSLDALAGKDTSLDVSVAVTIAATVTLAGVGEAFVIKYLRGQVKQRDLEIAALKRELVGADNGVREVQP